MLGIQYLASGPTPIVLNNNANNATNARDPIPRLLAHPYSIEKITRYKYCYECSGSNTSTSGPTPVVLEKKCDKKITLGIYYLSFWPDPYRYRIRKIMQ
jgi:hypothetical protein